MKRFLCRKFIFCVFSLIYLLLTQLQLANATFVSAWSATDISTTTYSLMWVDYNNDSKLDQARTARDYLYVRRNDTINTAEFTTVFISTECTSWCTVSAADFDNDGWNDILSCVLWKNNRNNTFTAVWSLPLSEVTVDSADMNNDGKVDIIAGRHWNDRIRIYKNLGNNNFSILWTSTETFPSCSDIVAADLDNDGLLDLTIACCTSPGRVYIFKQYENNIFLNVNTIIPSYPLKGIAVGDMDNDGDLDLAIGIAEGIMVYRNDNFMNFSLFFQHTDSGYFTSVPSWGDYNNDGRLDLAVAVQSGYTSNTRVFRNDVSSFTLVWNSPVTIYSTDVSWGDYNNDGKLDILSGVSHGNDTVYCCTDPMIPVNTAPSPPTAFFANVYSSSIVFQWNDGSDAETPKNVLGYILKIGTTPGGREIMSEVTPPDSIGNYKTFNTTTPDINRYILKTEDLKLSDVTFYWQIKAVDSGYKTSPWSTEQKIYLQIPPAQVTDLSATRIDDTIAQLVWTAVGDDGLSNDIVGGKYEIRYTTNATDSWDNAPYSILKTTNTTPGSIERFTITGLTLKATYYFWLKTADEVLNWSELSNKTIIYLQIPPAAVTDLSAEAILSREGEMQLSWTAPGDDGIVGKLQPGSMFEIRYSSYSIDLSSYQSITISTADVNPGTQQIYLVSGLVLASSYYFALRTADEALNWSEMSNIVACYYFVPQLSWVGVANFESDGLDPELGTPTTTYTYQVKYTCILPPKIDYPKVHIAKNLISISGSPFTMNYVSGNYKTGAIYSYSTKLPEAGSYSYYFEAYNSLNNAASGAPTSIQNGPKVSAKSPSLSWTEEQNYTDSGVYPLQGKPNSETFDFRIKYTDIEDDPPQSGYPKLYIKKGDQNIFGSPFTMNYVSGNYKTGAIYSVKLTFSAVGNDYKYFFGVYDIFGQGGFVVTQEKSFTVSTPPLVPENKSGIQDGQVITSGNVVLLWSSSDPDGDTLTYFLYIAKNNQDSWELYYSGPNTSYQLYLEPGVKYFWRVDVQDQYGVLTTGRVFNFRTPSDKLFNYPNPFNPLREKTNIVIYSNNEEKTQANIKIYNEFGQLVFDKIILVERGWNIFPYDGRDNTGEILYNGTYIITVKVNNRVDKCIMLVLK